MEKRMFRYLLLLSSLLCIQATAKDFKLVSVQAPNSYIKSACGDKLKMAQTVLYVEVQAGSDVIWRSKGQSIAGIKSSFYFNEKFSINDKESNVVIRILVGEKEAFERGLRAGAGAAGGAGIGALIGGIAAGVCTGGLGAPAGAGIGAIIGGAGGAAVVQLLPIEGSREVQSFAFYSLSGVSGKHSRDCGNGDILADGQKIEIEIK